MHGLFSLNIALCIEMLWLTMSHVAKFILNMYQTKHTLLIDLSETVNSTVMLVKITVAEWYLFSYSIE